MYPSGEADVSARHITTEGGVRVRIAESGSATALPVLMLHGWGCSLYAFRHLFAPLVRLGKRAIAIDLQGHGLSDKPVTEQSYSVAAMTSHVIDIIRSLRLPATPEVIGHSMGGRIAVEVALREPQLVGRLVLVNPVGFGPMPHVDFARPFARELVASICPAPLPSRVVRIPVAAVYGRIGSCTARDVEEYRAPTQFREFLHASVHLLRGFDWKMLPPGRAALLRDRAVLIAGELDRVVQCARRGWVTRYVDAGWTVRLVHDVAHVVHEEAPWEVSAVFE
jgi:pimeloyl-ACP methyl ester carboxylesterase